MWYTLLQLTACLLLSDCSHPSFVYVSHVRQGQRSFGFIVSFLSWIFNHETACTGSARLRSQKNFIENSKLNFCFQKWRGTEKELPMRTRLLRVWHAWCSEQSNVEFWLAKSKSKFSQRRFESGRRKKKKGTDSWLAYWTASTQRWPVI